MLFLHQETSLSSKYNFLLTVSVLLNQSFCWGFFFFSFKQPFDA